MTHAQPSPSSSDSDLPHQHDWEQLNGMQLCLLDVLLQQLPEVHGLLEESMVGITEEFVALAKDWQEMSDILGSDGGDAMLPIDHRKLEAIQQRFGKLTVSMQFQDRVSQNLLAACDALQQVADKIQGCLDHQDVSYPVDTDLAKAQLAALRLGDLQTRYVEALQKRQFIATGSEVGFDHSTSAQAKDDDDIDLF